jgi:hypothetical protein
MDPKIADIWNGALDKLKRAEKHLNEGESELVKSEAKKAARSGQIAIMLLLRGREDDREAAEIAFDQELFDDWQKTSSRPQDYITKAKKLLKGYSNLSPPENKLLF